MFEKRNIWETWSRQLHRWGLADFVGHLLESLNGFNELIVHILYLVEPFAPLNGQRNGLGALIALFNDEHNRTVFLQILEDTADERS